MVVLRRYNSASVWTESSPLRRLLIAACSIGDKDKRNVPLSDKKVTSGKHSFFKWR